MTYLIIYQIGGIGRWFLDAAFDNTEDAQRHAQAAAREHPGRAYEMHPVNPKIAALLDVAVTA